MTILPGNQELQNTMMMYQEYAPKVLEWMSQVLRIQFKPNQDFLFIMRSGDLLCRLACALYQNVECHLLDKGLEYGIHKIIFFLELCKSLHIKRSLLFQVSDILVWPDNDPHRKHALIVLRTIIALEKHARKSGWNGPTIQLKQQASMSLGVSSRDSVVPNLKNSYDQMREPVNPPPMVARRPSIPVNFNPPPPPIDPPSQLPSRSSSQSSQDQNKYEYQRRNSQDKYDYQPRRKTSYTPEFNAVLENKKSSSDERLRQDRSARRPSEDRHIQPRQESLRNQEPYHPPEKEVRFADEFPQNEFRKEVRFEPRYEERQTPISMIPQATQVVGQNYEDSSDNESLSDQISELSALMKESLGRRSQEDNLNVVDHKQILRDAINQRISMRTKNIEEFIEEEVQIVN